jgi:Transglutaminase-like superfamily
MSARHASGGGEMKQQQLGPRLSQLWLALCVGLWLCGLPIRWRVHSLPRLPQRLTPAQERPPRRNPVELYRAVWVVRRICRLRLFRGPLFAQASLRQALALYHILTRLGYPIAIHFGVYRAGEALRGHSWVTVDGRPVAGRMPPETLQAIDTFPVAGSRGSRTEVRFHPLHPTFPRAGGGLEGAVPPPVSR